MGYNIYSEWNREADVLINVDKLGMILVNSLAWRECRKIQFFVYIFESIFGLKCYFHQVVILLFLLGQI